MSQTTVHAPEPALQSRHATVWHVVRRVLMPAASLRITVVLFALSLVLIFVGTLAQVDAGIFSVVNTYFRSLYVWVPLQIFFPRSWHVSGQFPYPGGWLLGGLLLVNLLAAHVVRFRLSWKRSGILLLHTGLVIMMVSELVTGLASVEGRMTIEEGGACNFTEVHDAVELAVIDPSDPKVDRVVVVPQADLKKGGVIHNDLLPFDVEVVQYLVNSTPPRAVSSGTANPATAGDGRTLVAEARPEVSGTDQEGAADIAAAYVTFKKKTGESLGTYLVSQWWSDWVPVGWGTDRPQKVADGNKTYNVYLRSKRIYKPYTIRLKKFTHSVYPGTDIPKDFASDIQVVDASGQGGREVKIYMNNPLRYGGETFYQSGYLPGDRGTILQVVRNPGWLMPYVSCALVSGGMLVHFGLMLLGFLQKRAAS